MIFMAGHGSSKNNNYYFLSFDARPGQELSTCVTQGNLAEAMSTVQCPKVLFLDACKSGSMTKRGYRTAPVDMEGFMNDLNAMDYSPYMFTASGSNQDAMEHPDWENGAFTEALITGMSGDAAYNKPKISVLSLS